LIAILWYVSGELNDAIALFSHEFLSPMTKLTAKDVQALIESASPEVQRIIQRVLEIEKDRLDRNDRGLVNADILRIVKEAVQ